MRWLKPNIRSSIYGLLGNPASPTESALENRTEDVREAMLAALGPSAPQQLSQITRRIRYANDIHALWYLRADLMGALAQMHDETTAREQIHTITGMFQGLLSNGLNSRPSPLVE